MFYELIIENNQIISIINGDYRSTVLTELTEGQIRLDITKEQYDAVINPFGNIYSYSGERGLYDTGKPKSSLMRITREVI